MRDDLVRFVFDQDLMLALLASHDAVEPLMEIVRYWSFGDKAATGFWVDRFEDGTAKVISVGQLSPYLSLLKELMALEDHLSNWRLDFCLSSYMNALFKLQTERALGDKLVMWIMSRAKDGEKIKKWLAHNIALVNELFGPLGYRIRQPSSVWKK